MGQFVDVFGVFFLSSHYMGRIPRHLPEALRHPDLSERSLIEVCTLGRNMSLVGVNYIIAVYRPSMGMHDGHAWACSAGWLSAEGRNEESLAMNFACPELTREGTRFVLRWSVQVPSEEARHLGRTDERVLNAMNQEC